MYEARKQSNAKVKCESCGKVRVQTLRLEQFAPASGSWMPEPAPARQRLVTNHFRLSFCLRLMYLGRRQVQSTYKTPRAT